MHPNCCLRLASSPRCQPQSQAGPQPSLMAIVPQGTRLSWQEDLARPILPGCSHCVFENLDSHLCYCLGGRPNLPAAFLPPLPRFLPAFLEHALRCTFLGGGQTPLHPHARPCVRTWFCVLVLVVREQRDGRRSRPSDYVWPSGSRHVCMLCLPPSSGQPGTEMLPSNQLANPGRRGLDVHDDLEQVLPSLTGQLCHRPEGCRGGGHGGE